MSGTVAIINYGSGNLRSAAKAFEYVATKLGLPYRVEITSDSAVIRTAAKIVLPGQGAFGDCMQGLMAKPAVFDAMTAAVQEAEVPFFGICVGMQLLTDQGVENGVHTGLGWLGGVTRRMLPSDPNLKIPHMGWNTLELQHNHPALQHITSEDHFYFVHSFVVELKDRKDLLATTDYGGPQTAIIGNRNLLGVQFHPEKSQAAGLRLIKGFLQWRP